MINSILRRAAIAASFVAMVAPPASAANPPLNGDPAAMAAAITCSGNVQNATVNPVLMIHGTGSTSAESWGWNYARALPSIGRPFCTVDMLGRELVSIYDSVEYLVYAIRYVHQLSGRKVTLLGHSQAGTHQLWALKWWSDLPNHVDEVIGLAGAYRGTQLADIACASGSCREFAWETRPGSNMVAAMSSGGLLQPGIDYTSIVTQTDEVVFPSGTVSHLPDGANVANIAVQDICPGRVVDHIGMLADGVAWAVAADALTHSGPANRNRINPLLVCPQLFLPNVDLVGGSQILSTGTQFVIGAFLTPGVNQEPPLPAYAQ